MNNKKKIIAICVCVALLAGTILSGTIAYFTDNEAITNTFTSGNIDLTLTEHYKENEEGNKLAAADADKDGTADYFEDLKLFPADVITKEPVITVEAGSENAFVAAKITIKAADLTEANDLTEPDLVDTTKTPQKLDVTQLLKGGILNGSITEVEDAQAAQDLLVEGTATTDYIMYQTYANNTYTFYVYKVEAVVTIANGTDGANADESFTLFETLNIPSNWDNAEMDELEDLDITVHAFAAQEKHLDDCYTAMASAFDGEFPEVA